MDFQVLITDQALEDLRAIVEFVAQDDPHAALRLGEKMVTAALSLTQHPLRCPFHERERGIRKMTLAAYLIFYTCDEATRVVSILHLWHGARRTRF